MTKDKRTSPVSRSNLYILNPGLFGPSCVLFGVTDGDNIAHEIGRPKINKNHTLNSGTESYL